MSEITITRADCGMITLRGDGTGFAEAVVGATGLDLPQIRRMTSGEGTALASMSPDEWLFLCPKQAVEAHLAALTRALSGQHHLALDVSDARARFQLAGPLVREVIAKGSPADMARGAFGPGDIRRTRLGQVAAALWMPEEDRIDLVCFRSVSGFVEDWLRHAARAGAEVRFL